jgi:FkbM family methyltransferase
VTQPPPSKRSFAARAIRKGLRVFDPVLSRLERRASGIEVRSALSHEERLVVLSFRGGLRAPATVVYDIGAATGRYAAALAKVATVSQVIAFEPLSESFAELERRARENPRIRCFRLALGDGTGQVELRRSAWRDTSSVLPVGETIRTEFPLAAEIEGTETVELTRLDDVVAEHALPRPDVVKMDVQGVEDRVIRGGAQTLRGARLCVIEVSFRPLYEGSALFDDVYAAMRELGFALVAFDTPLLDSNARLLQANAFFEPAAADE